MAFNGSKNDKTILPYIFEDLTEGLEPMRPPQPPKKLLFENTENLLKGLGLTLWPLFWLIDNQVCEEDEEKSGGIPLADISGAFIIVSVGILFAVIGRVGIKSFGIPFR